MSISYQWTGKNESKLTFFPSALYDSTTEGEVTSQIPRAFVKEQEEKYEKFETTPCPGIGHGAGGISDRLRSQRRC